MELTDQDIRHYADAYLASCLKEDEEFRIEGLTERDYRKCSETLDISDGGR